MKFTLFILFLLLPFFLFAQQNLVPNPSFEYYSSCPTGSGQLPLASPWTATPNDAEYYNSCASNLIFSVPNQGGYNFQYAHSGNAFIGMNFYDGIDNNYREYAQVIMLSPLQSNHCYYVEFYVNLAGGWGGKYAVNNIACSFSNNAVTSQGTSNNVLNLTPYVYKYGNPIIKDTLNWTKISGIYNALGGEQYIVIGNFKNDSNTDTLYTGVGYYANAYYYIDDVSVIPIDSISMSAHAGHNTSIVLGDSVFIGQEITNLNCNWYVSGNLIASNVPGFYVNPTTTTTYMVEQNLCGAITYDTITVQVNLAGISGHEKANNYVQVFPNPATNYLTINWTLADKSVFEIIDITGAKRQSLALESSSSSTSISLSKFDNGLYYYIIRDKNGNNIKSDKFIIQK